MKEVEQAIADQWAGFKVALLNGDAEGWASFWTPDAWLMEPGMDKRGRLGRFTAAWPDRETNPLQAKPQ